MSLNSISQSQRLKTEICRNMQSTLTYCLGGTMIVIPKKTDSISGLMAVQPLY